MNTAEEKLNQAACRVHHLAIRDAMDLLSGKWKIRLIGSLSFGPQRFMTLKGGIEGIAAKMLSKELQELELNGLIKRSVLNTKPIMVEYELTAYGYTLKPLIDMLAAWGMQHRENVIKGMETTPIVVT